MAFHSISTIAANRNSGVIGDFGGSLNNCRHGKSEVGNSACNQPAINGAARGAEESIKAACRCKVLDARTAAPTEPVPIVTPDGKLVLK